MQLLRTTMIVSLMCATMQAGVTLPNTFKPNTPAKASEVNANFTTLAHAIDSNAAAATDNKTAINANTTQIQNKQNQITGSCPAGSSIRAVAADGSVTCQSDHDTTYTAGTGITIDGTMIRRADGYVSVGYTGAVRGQQGINGNCPWRADPSDGYGYFLSGGGENKCQVHMPVHLPHGAKITWVDCEVYNDTASGNQNATIGLYEESISGGSSYAAVAGPETIGDSSSWQTVSPGLFGRQPTVDNEHKFYYIEYEVTDANTSHDTKRLKGCTVRYSFQ